VEVTTTVATTKQTQAAKRNVKRAQLAKEKGIPGRSNMGKWDLIEAIRKAG
jgi:hypothetical protein